jgi:hypothetical protein
VNAANRIRWWRRMKRAKERKDEERELVEKVFCIRWKRRSKKKEEINNKTQRARWNRNRIG